MTLSDPDVIQVLSTEVIPVWESVGAVPKVTIELGNGRTLERTLGGNIVTYILSSDGDVYDALPGVYTPGDYLNELRKTLHFVKELKQPADVKVITWHRAQFADTVQLEQQRITLSKAFVESPLLKALNLDPADTTTEESKFRDISKDPATVKELKIALLKESKSNDPHEIGRRAVEVDSRNNLKLMRPAIHLLYSNYRTLPKVAEFRDVIYKQLLHIPLDDPYLGLADALVPGTPDGH